MDVLYPVCRDREFDNIELRWSLRSLEKYGKNVDRVIVSGKPPEWLSDEVVKIDVMPVSNIVQKNIFKNVYEAYKMGAVTGDFVLSADDHFYMREVDFDNFPLYVMGEIQTTISPNARNVEYQMGLVFSRWLLSMNGLTTYMTSNHNSIPISARAFEAYRPIVDACLSSEYRINVWALLGNMFLGVRPGWQKITRERDIKITDRVRYEQIADETAGEHCFSIGDGELYNEDMVRFLNDRFPSKSKWEK